MIALPVLRVASVLSQVHINQLIFVMLVTTVKLVHLCLNKMTALQAISVNRVHLKDANAPQVITTKKLMIKISKIVLYVPQVITVMETHPKPYQEIAWPVIIVSLEAELMINSPQPRAIIR